MGDEIVEVKVYAEGGAMPVQATPGAAGWDLSARIGVPLRLNQGDRAEVPTGLWLAIPAGYEGQVRPRSGLARDYGVTVTNAPGTVDSDHRGEVRVLLVNHGPRAVIIPPGDRIAQLVIAPVPRVRLVAVGSVDDLGVTERGTGGFGSTGSGALGGGFGPSSDALPGQLGLFGGMAGDEGDDSDDKNDNAAGDRGPMEV